MKQTTTRKRALYDWIDQSGVSHFSTERREKSSGALISKTDESRNASQFYSSSKKSSQVTTSENHPEFGPYVRKHVKFEGDLGGPFFTQKKLISLVFPQKQHLKGEIDLSGGVYVLRGNYHGPVWVTPPASLSFPSASMRNLAPLGTTAIARCKPTNQIADASVFMAELYTDGLPKLFGATLWKESVLRARNAGDEYLNYEFGWKPLVSDISSISRAVTHSHKTLSDYERGSGQMVRRRYEFPIERTATTVNLGTAEPEGIMSPTSAQSLFKKGAVVPSLLRTTRTWRRTWFSGAFTYHMPSGYYSRNVMERYGAKADALLGTGLDPETIWEAMPWSWAIDWFSNAGDVISNLSDWATDGLVLRYGYVMEHEIITQLYHYAGDYGNYYQSSCYPSPVLVSVETKRREVATPFGFEVTWGGLSPRQLAISAALGLTKSFR